MVPRPTGHVQVVRGPPEAGAEAGQDVEVAGPFAVGDLMQWPLEQVHELVRRGRRELLRSLDEMRVKGHPGRVFQNRSGAEAS